MEHLPAQGGYLLYPNHQGMFDVLAILYLMPHAFSVVLKKELQNIPFLKQVFACMGALSLDRSDPREGMKVILQVAEEVKQGRRFLIFAEGTRSRKGNQLLDFKGGSFKSAIVSRQSLDRSLQASLPSSIFVPPTQRLCTVRIFGSLSFR